MSMVLHLQRESDACLFLKAGPEIGVCSTKAFTSQVVVLSLFCLMMARMRHMSKREGQEFLNALQKLPEQVQSVLDQAKQIRENSKKICSLSKFLLCRPKLHVSCKLGRSLEIERNFLYQC